MEIGMIFDGRAGDPNVVDEATRKKIAEYLERTVGDLRCPDHDKAPTIVCTGDNLENMSFDVKGCSQKFVFLVKEKLSEG